MGRRIAGGVDVHDVFDPQTTFWDEETLPAWLTPPQARFETVSTEMTQGPDSAGRAR
jgi:hypothetical protein